jgi:hypothetical protein
VDGLPTEAEALFAVAPDDFVEERKRIARSLRDDGRREHADTVAALKKPAPVVLAANRAARERPEAAKTAAKAAERVAKTQLGSDPNSYRGALGELDASLDALAEVALAHLSKEGKPPTDAVSRRLRDLLRNAVADEDARGELVRGLLREETETTGFGAFAGVTPTKPPRKDTKAGDAARRRREAENRRERKRALGDELTEAESALEEAVRAERQAERSRREAERAVEALQRKLARLRDDA